MAVFYAAWQNINRYPLPYFTNHLNRLDPCGRMGRGIAAKFPRRQKEQAADQGHENALNRFDKLHHLFSPLLIR